jgi:hypothetical protein
LRTEREYNNQMLRQNELNYSNICFNNIVENLVLFKRPTPCHVIYFGDFNYRISTHCPGSQIAKELNENVNNKDYIHDLYNVYDELHQQMIKRNIYTFCEGVSNEGPTFLPTCKMDKKRYEKHLLHLYKNHYGQSLNNQSPNIIYPQNYNNIHNIPQNYNNNALSSNNMHNIPQNYNIIHDIPKNYNNNGLSSNNSVLSNNQSLDNMKIDDIVLLQNHQPSDGSTQLPNYKQDNFNNLSNNMNYPAKNFVLQDVEEYKNIAWSTGKEDQRVPSWCDRVLYKKFAEDNRSLVCTHYDRFDIGSTMSKSDHAGVIATFELF